MIQSDSKKTRESNDQVMKTAEKHGAMWQEQYQNYCILMKLQETEAEKI